MSQGLTLRRFLVVMALGLLAPALLSSPAEDFNPGLQVGQRLPPFRIPDQDGNLQDFRSIRGPKGLALLFHRSADW